MEIFIKNPKDSFLSADIDAENSITNSAQLERSEI